MVYDKGRALSKNFPNFFVNVNSPIVSLLIKCDNGKSLDLLNNKERENFWMLLMQVLQDHSQVDILDYTKRVKNIFELLHYIILNSTYQIENEIEFINILTYINSDAFTIPDASLKHIMSLINEHWLIKKQNASAIPGMEYFTLKHLFETCSTNKPTVVDIQRLNNIRKVITTAPFEIAVPSLKPGLIKLVQNQSVLHSEHGQRFIAHALILSQRLALDVHKTILLELGSCSKKQAGIYAKVYVIAWQNGKVEMKNFLEKTCFQHLMELFLKEQRTSLELTKTAQNLVSVLDVWHSERKKKNSDFIAMITNCYQPFIWKYLESGFNVHRCNAVDLLFKVFPLQRPGDNILDAEHLFNQQFAAMLSALTDDCHIVRIIAVREICNILSHYWNSFTPIQIHRLLTVISKEDAHDSSCADVRRMVYIGFKSFLHNPLAFEYLKNILPAMADNIHDVNQKVRIAFIELLIAIKEKGDANFKYGDCIPAMSLYYRLAEDNLKVGELIVNLLLSSYFQENMPVVEWTKRFIFLIKTYRMSYRNFFLYSQKVLTFENAFNIMYELIVQLGVYVLSKSTSDNSNVENEGTNQTKIKKTKFSKNKKPLTSTNARKDREDIERSEKAKTKECAFDDPTVVGGLFDIVTILWILHDNTLNKTENQDKRIKLYEAFITYAQPFINYYKSTTLFSSVLSLSGNIPASLLRSNSITLPGYCMKMLKLEKMESCSFSDRVLSVLIALIKWGKGSDILEQVTLWLDAAFETQNINSSILPRRRVKINEVIQPNSVVAINILDTLMKTEFVKASILKKNYDQLHELWKFMSRVKILIEARLEQGDPFEDDLVSDKFLKLCFKRYVKLIPLLKDNKDADNDEGETGNIEDNRETLKVNYQEEIEELMRWAEKVLDPYLAEKKLNLEAENIALITSIYNDILYVADNMIILHIVNRQFYLKICHLALKLLDTDYCLHFVKAASRIATAVNYSGKLLFNVNDDLHIFPKIIPCVISRILNVLTSRKLTDEEIAVINSDLPDVKSNFGKILETYQDNFKLKTSSKETVKQLQMLLGLFVNALVNLMSEEILPESADLPTYSNITQLPVVVNVFMSLFYNKKFWGSMFIHVLNATLIANVYDLKCQLACIVIFHFFATHDKKINKSELRKALSTASTLLSRASSKIAKERENSIKNNSLLSVSIETSNDPKDGSFIGANENDEKANDTSNSALGSENYFSPALIQRALELITESQVQLIRNEE